MAKLSLTELDSQSKLDTVPLKDGQLIFVSDTGNIFKDTKTARISVGKDVKVVDELPLTPISNKLYLLNNELYAYIDSNWKVIGSNSQSTQSVQPDWNENNVESSAFIKNRPIYAKGEPIEIQENLSMLLIILSVFFNILAQSDGMDDFIIQVEQYDNMVINLMPVQGEAFNELFEYLNESGLDISGFGTVSPTDIDIDSLTPDSYLGGQASVCAYNDIILSGSGSAESKIIQSLNIGNSEESVLRLANDSFIVFVGEMPILAVIKATDEYDLSGDGETVLNLIQGLYILVLAETDESHSLNATTISGISNVKKLSEQYLPMCDINSDSQRDGLVKLSDIETLVKNLIPTSLPANGGNADTVGGIGVVIASDAPTDNNKNIMTIVI